LLGRNLIPGDYAGAPARVAVISGDLWKKTFNGDPTLLGRTLRLNGQDVVVVGVMRDDFAKPNGAKVWLPRPHQ